VTGYVTNITRSPDMFDIALRSVNWKRFFNLVNAMGDELNDRKDRFDKSDILEQGVQVYSDEKFEWVDDIGRDHKYGDITSEMKTQKFCLYTKSGCLKKRTGAIKLMNSLGDASTRNKKDVIRFDYLKIIDTGSPSSFSVAFIHKNDIKEDWLDFSKDGVTVQIPINQLNFVVKPENIILDNKCETTSYKQEKQDAQRRYIGSF
tara:strand:+ start:51 stop:662 length:612 start_codon:yes stop_codon:yes gene_type:complete